ncbi:MAG: RecQ family ATP-dependent DNA helicase [Capnocytophaga sp.]|nr:RecQ family ATP-dependent DNA helicase [Capnocytophaga sp.]
MEQLLKDILQKYWGYSDFRPAQKPIVEAIMSGKDTLAMLPTGGGKSICFQVPALAQDGICLVISPLISLMEDQVNNLISFGIKAVCLTGNIPYNELDRILTNAACEAYKFLYIAPERLQNNLVQERIKAMNINLIVIDEAHCISHWGKDFRPAYLNCKKLKNWHPQTPIIALTATATEQVQKDIIDNLQISKATIIKSSLGRNNLAYMKYFSDDKKNFLIRILRKNKESAIVYVRNRQLTNELSQFLVQQGFTATSYHGGLSVEEKNTRLSIWKLDDIQIMVATNAFGMGIDKPDVRTVIHWDLPPSLEDYFQEAGRAGRDGNKAYAILLYNENDCNKLKINTNQSLISLEYLKDIYKKLCSFCQIAYGEGVGVTCGFHLGTFCQRFGLETIRVYRAMEVLDRNSIISLNQTFSRKATLQILVNNNDILEYVQQNSSEKELIYHLIRTYSGIYTQNIPILIEKTAVKLKISTEKLLKQLEKLKNNGIIDFKYENSDAEITFLVPRDDDRTINFIKPQIKWFNDHKIEQAKSVLNFIENNKCCNQKYLLAYFDEKTEHDCGICSYCLEKNNKNKPKNLQPVKDFIIHLLQEKPMDSQEIFLKSEFLLNDILKSLQELFEENKININISNQYYLE